jgi:hypothetical protein
VVRGDLTLDQAADRFEKLNEENGDALDALRTWHPGVTDAELVRRQVVQAVRGLRDRAPREVAAILPRLEAKVTRRFPPASPEGPTVSPH